MRWVSIEAVPYAGQLQFKPLAHAPNSPRQRPGKTQMKAYSYSRPFPAAAIYQSPNPRHSSRSRNVDSHFKCNTWLENNSAAPPIQRHSSLTPVFPAITANQRSLSPHTPSSSPQRGSRALFVIRLRRGKWEGPVWNGRPGGRGLLTPAVSPLCKGVGARKRIWIPAAARKTESEDGQIKGDQTSLWM